MLEVPLQRGVCAYSLCASGSTATGAESASMRVRILVLCSHCAHWQSVS